MAYGNPIPFESLIGRALDFDSAKSDYRSQDFQIQFNDQANLALMEKVSEYQITPYELTPHAWSQFAQKMGPVAFGRGSQRSLPTEALLAWKQVFPAQLADLLNQHLNAYQGGLFVRTFGDTARAILSDRYAVIDNSHILEVADKALKEVAAKNPSIQVQTTDRHAWVTPDQMHVKITLVNVSTPDGDYGIGAYLGNNEIGLGKVRCTAFLQRHRCQNSIVFLDTDSNLDAVHRGVGQILWDRMAIAIFHAFQLGQEGLASFLNAQTIAIPDFEKELLKFADAQGWGVELTTRAMRGSEGQDTLFGFINALTYTAQALEMDDRIKLEMKAGAILQDPSLVFGDRVQLAVVEQ